MDLWWCNEQLIHVSDNQEEYEFEQYYEQEEEEEFEPCNNIQHLMLGLENLRMNNYNEYSAIVNALVYAQHVDSLQFEMEQQQEELAQPEDEVEEEEEPVAKAPAKKLAQLQCNQMAPSVPSVASTPSSPMTTGIFNSKSIRTIAGPQIPTTITRRRTITPMPLRSASSKRTVSGLATPLPDPSLVQYRQPQVRRVAQFELPPLEEEPKRKLSTSKILTPHLFTPPGSPVKSRSPSSSNPGMKRIELQHMFDQEECIRHFNRAFSPSSPSTPGRRFQF